MARRLLPNAPAANYNALVTASVGSEGLVNGIWFSCVSFAMYISQTYRRTLSDAQDLKPAFPHRCRSVVHQPRSQDQHWGIH
jgi:hypothetical protein